MARYVLYTIHIFYSNFNKILLIKLGSSVLQLRSKFREDETAIQKFTTQLTIESFFPSGNISITLSHRKLTSPTRQRQRELYSET